MKKLSKALLLTLLIAAMVLNTCGVVLANTTGAEITIKEEVVDAAQSVYKLVFSVKTPAGGTGISATGLVFSYDNTVIQPVRKDTLANVTLTESTSNTAAGRVFGAFANDDYEFEFSPFGIIVNDARTAVRVDTYLAEEDVTIDATNGIVFTEFFYKILDTEAANGETFIVESDYSEGSFLKSFYLDAVNAAPVKVGDYSYYGNSCGTDTASIASITYTGSDKLVLKELALNPSATEVNVPTVIPQQNAATVTIGATAKSSVNTDMAVPADAVWSLVEELDGVSIAGSGASATLTVTSEAAAGSAVVKLTADGKEATTTITINKATPAPAKIVVKANGADIVNNRATLVKPATPEAGEKELALSAVVYDQYGNATEETVSYLLAGGTSNAALGADAKVIADYETTEGTVILDVTNGTLTETITIDVVGLLVNWSEVIVADELTYGATNASAVTLPAAGTATVDGETVNGVYSVVNADDVQGAGAKTITVMFKANADEGEYADVEVTKAFDVTINKADQVITASDVTVTYDGTAKSVEGTTSGDGEITYSPAQSYTDAGTYNITITAAATNNYNAATEEVTLTINKATATGFVTEAPAETATAKEAFEDAVTLEGFKAELPATAEVSYGEGLTAEVEMTWADATQAWDAKGGTYTFVGTPANDNLNLGTLTLTATYTVTPVTGTLTEGLSNITVAAAALAVADGYDDIRFPASIEVTYEGEDTPVTIDTLTWTKTLEELKEVAVDDSTTVGLAEGTFPVWATITNANEFTFAVTEKLPVNVAVTMNGGTYGDELAGAIAEQIAITDEDGIDETDASFTYIYTDSEGIESETVPTNAGTYTVTATLVSDTHAGSASATFVIEARDVNVTVADATMEYSDENPEFTYDIDDATPIVDGDDLAIVYDCVDMSAATAGSTTTINATSNNANYDVNVTAGTLTVVQKPFANTTFVPVISGTAAVGEVLTAAVEGLDASEFTYQWMKGETEIEGATGADYTPAFVDSGATDIKVKITAAAEGNYAGTLESAVVEVAVYEISGELASTITDVDGTEALRAGDIVTVDVTSIDDYAELVAAGATFAYEWKLDGEAVADATEATFTVVEGMENQVLSVTVTVSAPFAGSIDKEIAEIGKAPLTGTITLEAEEVEDATTITAVVDVVGDYDLVWLRGETDITSEVVDGVYTVTSVDYGQTITVKAVATGEDYSGTIEATYDVAAIAPSNIEITTEVTTSSLTVTLTADANGADIESFEVTIVGANDYTETATVTEVDGVFTYTFEDLVSGASYDIIANATNAAGTSEDATATATLTAESSRRPRPSTTTPSTPVTPSTPDDTETEEPKTEVSVTVEETSATLGSDELEGMEEVNVEVKTTEGANVGITTNIKDAGVEEITASADETEAAISGPAAAEAVGSPIAIGIEAKNAAGEAVEVAATVSIPAEEGTYAYIVDENGTAVRADASYDAETGALVVADVANGTVIIVSKKAPAKFEDIADRWSEDEIHLASDRGIVNGVSEGIYNPNGLLTRFEGLQLNKNLSDVASIAWEIDATKAVDTAADHWAFATATWAAQAGITNGVGTSEDGKVVVNGESNVLRQDFFVMIARQLQAAGVEATGEDAEIADLGDAGDYAVDYIKYLVKLGVLKGTSADGAITINPAANITREEAGAVTNRAYEAISKAGKVVLYNF